MPSARSRRPLTKLMINLEPRIHSTAAVSSDAHLGNGTSVWHRARVRSGAAIGEGCTIGTGAYIDRDVIIGNNVKIQNHALIYRGATIEDGVFIGPQACLINDRIPRAITPDGHLKSEGDWTIGPILVRYGASIGASAVVLAGVTIGRFAMVGAGAVVTRDVPDHGLVIGVPAKLEGRVCKCGERLVFQNDKWFCPACERVFQFDDDKVTSSSA